jgi:hypothetical protein
MKIDTHRQIDQTLCGNPLFVEDGEAVGSNSSRPPKWLPTNKAWSTADSSSVPRIMRP